MSRAQQILELRELMDRHRSAPVRQARAHLPTGIAQLDALLEGGLWKGAMMELTSPAPSSGVSLLMLRILRHAAARGLWFALIDGNDCFDPQSAGPELLGHLLWLRCRSAREAMGSADLLLRDGNLPLVILDLRGIPAAQLRKIPDTSWHRLQRIIEPTSLSLVALTAQPLICCADVRIVVQSFFEMDALERDHEQLLGEIVLEVTRKRSANQWPLAEAG